MSKRLAGTVHVQDDDGNDHMFTPDDDVPAWAAEKITNPKAWADGKDDADEAEAPAPRARNRRGGSDQQ